MVGAGTQRQRGLRGSSSCALSAALRNQLQALAAHCRGWALHALFSWWSCCAIAGPLTSGGSAEANQVGSAALVTLHIKVGGEQGCRG